MRTSACAVLLAAVVGVGCGGRITRTPFHEDASSSSPNVERRPTSDATLVVDSRSSRADAYLPIDAGRLPGRGEPCPGGECTDDALCVAFTGYCEPKCTLPGPCNAKMPECDDDRYCFPLTSFWGVCMPAGAGLGERCGPRAGDAACVGGTLCVQDLSGVARCLAQCEGATCPGGRPCVGLDRGDCRVCPR